MVKISKESQLIEELEILSNAKNKLEQKNIHQK